LLENIFIGLGILFAFLIGIVLGGVLITVLRGALMGRRARIADRKAIRIEAEARLEAKRIVDEAKQEIEKTKAAAENETRQRRAEMQRNENRLTQKIDSLDQKLETLERRDRNLNAREKETETIRTSVVEIRDKQLKKLEEISNLTTADAKKILLENVEAEMKQETARRIGSEATRNSRPMKRPRNLDRGHSAFSVRNRLGDHRISSTHSE
jgi:ribonuclease Y